MDLEAGHDGHRDSPGAEPLLHGHTLDRRGVQRAAGIAEAATLRLRTTPSTTGKRATGLI